MSNVHSPPDFAALIGFFLPELSVTTNPKPVLTMCKTGFVVLIESFEDYFLAERLPFRIGN